MSAPHRSHRSLRSPALTLPLALLASVFGLGCSHTTVTASPKFPSEQALAEIQTAPLPSAEAIFQRPPAAIDHWQLTTPLPAATSVSAYAGPDPVLRQLAERYAQAGKGRRVTEGLSCYAREKARFWLAHQAWAAEDVDDFVAARCGAGAAAIQTQFQYGERPAGEPLATVASMASIVDELVAQTPTGALVGVWVGSDDRYDIVSVVHAAPEVELDPMPMTTQAGYVDIEGTLGERAGWVQGFVTHGQRSYARCEPLPQHGQRTLALRCPTNGTDEYSMIEVFGAAPDNVLGHVMLRLMALAPSLDPTTPEERVSAYQAPILSIPVDPNDHSTNSYVAAINHLRRELYLEPLSLAHEQSTVVEGLLPHYLAARTQGETKLAEQIVLGMMAGWKVEGTIRDASLLTFQSNQAWSVERALAAALLSPAYRATIFDRNDSTLALGMLSDDTRAARAFMMLSYELFQPRTYDRERTALLDAVDRQRASMGKGPVVRIEGPKTEAVFQESIANLQSGESEPADELERVLQVFVDNTSRGFRGQAFVTMVIDGWEPELPRDLLLADDAWISMMVTYRKPPGSAWGEHVVMFVYSI